MKLLLDTHVWVWSQDRSSGLGSAAAKLLVDDSSSLYVSTVSSLEIARLAWGDRLTLDIPVGDWIEQSIDSLLADTLTMTHAVAIRAYSLPDDFHRDPADRILAASAIIHDLTPVTADEHLLAYPHIAAVDARP